MAKVKTYSLEYFAKALRDDTPDFKREMVKTVTVYAQGGNHHPQIDYEGPAPFFAADLYAKVYKQSAHDAFYPTPMRRAIEMAEWLNVSKGTIVLDPGSGFGALAWAVDHAGGMPVMVEYAQQINELANAAWAAHGLNLIPLLDFLDADQFQPPTFDAVIANPPHGKVFGQTYAEAAFLSRIADWARAKTPVCVILPQGYLHNTRPQATVDAIKRYRIMKQKDLPAGEFKPFTLWNTTLYLLETVADGPLFLQRNEMPKVKTDPNPAAKKPVVKKAAEKSAAPPVAPIAAQPEPLHSNLDNLPPMTAREARGWLKPLIDNTIKMSLSWPNQLACAIAQVLWNGARLDVRQDDDLIPALEARHIWRETHP